MSQQADQGFIEPFSFSLQCNECGEMHTYEIDYLYLSPEIQNCTEEELLEEPGMIVPSRLIECRSCKAVDQYRFTEEAFDTLMTRLIEAPGGLLEPPPNVEILDLQLTDGTPVKRPKQALDHLWDKVDKNPENAREWMHLANLVRRFGKIEEAESAFKEALDIAPEDAEILYNVADFKKQNSPQSQEAVQYLQKAVEKFPKLSESDRE